jgi:hypothetical protein
LAALLDSGDIILISLAINRLPIDRLARNAATDPTTLPIPTFLPSELSRIAKPLSSKSALISTLPVYDIFQRQAFQVTSQVFTE